MDEFILILLVLEYIIRFKTMSGKIIIASGCISGASICLHNSIIIKSVAKTVSPNMSFASARISSEVCRWLE